MKKPVIAKERFEMGKLNKLLGMIKQNTLFGTLRFLLYRMVLDLVRKLVWMIHFDTSKDGTKVCIDEFIGEVNKMKSPRILELGSRDISRKSQFHSYSEYVGFDIYPGNYVDVVGDAHRLSSYFPEGHFDAIYSISVFEHLAMPWKVVLEMNKVLKPGGQILIVTHPTCPPHALPWDFWRFSKAAFASLLNSKTGFEITKCIEGNPCVVLPLGTDKELKVSHRILSFLVISVIAKKSGPMDSALAWDVDIGSVVGNMYPLEYDDQVSRAFFDYFKKERKSK